MKVESDTDKTASKTKQHAFWSFLALAALMMAIITGHEIGHENV